MSPTVAPRRYQLPVEHALDYGEAMPRYGQLNEPYVASWFARDEPGGPMWALNLMKYRERAEYADGRESSISGMEADDVYAPHEHLRKVGSRLIMMAPVVHQLVGDEHVWDRIAIAQYRDRVAMIEMSSNADFQKDEDHKEAGMDFTIVMATFPVGGDPVPPQESGADDDRLMLLQVVGDAARTRHRRRRRQSTRIGRFAIEDRILGDDRTFAEARYDLISRDVADAARRTWLNAQRHRLRRHRRPDARRHRTFTHRHEQGAVLMEILRTSEADAAEILGGIADYPDWQPLRHHRRRRRCRVRISVSISSMRATRGLT